MYVKLANQVYPLTIPIERRGAKVSLKEKRISYREAWQRQHWNSLVSAYQNSPYFEYYEQEIKLCLDQAPAFLLDLHLDLLSLLLKWVGWEGEIVLSDAYHESEFYEVDLRKSFDPRLQKLPNWFIPIPYPQVFEGFDPGLSILDLLFNEGPATRTLLLQSTKKEWREGWSNGE